MTDAHLIDHSNDQVDARQYLQPLKRRKWLILVTLAAVTAATYVYTDRKPDEFRASTLIYVKSSEAINALTSSGIAVVRDADRNALDQATLLDTPPVAKEVAKDIDYEGDPAALLGAMTATPQEGKDFIEVTATGVSASEAADIANGFSEAFIRLRSDDTRGQITRALEAAQEELSNTPSTEDTAETRTAIQSRIRQLNAASSLPAGTAELVYPATAPAEPFAPRPIPAALFGFFVALVFSIAAAFGLERLDRRIKNLDDVEALYRSPMLGVLPKDSTATAIEDGVPILSKMFRESFRSLRVNVGLAALDRDLKTLVVISAVPNEGKSTVIRNLALAYAEAGLRVAVVESDLRKPMLSTTLNVEPRPGITDVLAGEGTVREALKQVRIKEAEELSLVGAGTGEGAKGDSGGSVLDNTLHTTPGSITLLTSGPEPPNPPVLGASEAFQAIINELRLDHDIVLLDTAPMLVVSDAIPLVEMADGALVVTRFNQTTRDAARSLVTILGRIPHANVLGVVCNQAPPNEGGGYSYYGYGYSNKSKNNR